MDILDEVQARFNIIAVIDRLGNSISEIESKNPNRTDLLKPMNESKTGLMQSLIIFDELRNELKLFKSHSGNLMLNIQMRDAKILELEQKNKELTELL
jgi:hypothetical protein